jgi:hypothetical protein
VWPAFVVVLARVFDEPSRFEQIAEPVLVQTFIAQPTDEALGKAFCTGLRG